MEGWACPVELAAPPKDEHDLVAALISEFRSLLPWYDLSRARRNRTTVGASGLDPEAATVFVGKFLNGLPDNPKSELSIEETLRQCVEDLKSFLCRSGYCPARHDPRRGRSVLAVERNGTRTCSDGPASTLYPRFPRRPQVTGRVCPRASRDPGSARADTSCQTGLAHASITTICSNADACLQEPVHGPKTAGNDAQQIQGEVGRVVDHIEELTLPIRLSPTPTICSRHSSGHGRSRSTPGDRRRAPCRAYPSAKAKRSEPIAHPKTKRNPTFPSPPRWKQ